METQTPKTSLIKVTNPAGLAIGSDIVIDSDYYTIVGITDNRITIKQKEKSKCQKR